MNLKKLTTLLFAGVTAATPFTTNAQNPTILQGNYVSNVFGQANFVLNPNAQTNIANVTVSNATVTRSTTTPLVATSEFNVAITSANGTATWATRTFDAGMKNQNCEARFSYRGFQATSKAQIKQGANVVAELTLTPSATDPRIASINFPCGDLSAATTFVITDTATLSGTHEIGGIYVGLATNQANVAQAELAGATEYASCAAQFSVTSATFASQSTVASCVLNNFGSATTTTKDLSITIPNAKPGFYQINANILPYTLTVGTSCYWTIKEDTSGYLSGSTYASPTAGYGASPLGASQLSASYNNTTTATRTWRVVARSTSGACQIDPTVAPPIISVYRFPTSSELVVTPETQNVWGGVVYNNQNQSLFAGSVSPTAFSSFNNATWNQPTLLKGKAAVTTTNSGNDLGFSIPNLPVGQYKVEISGLLQPVTATQSNTQVDCNWKIVETTTSSDVAKQATEVKTLNTTTNNTRDFVNSFSGVFSNTAVSTRNFRLEANKKADNSSGALGGCQVYSNTGPTSTLNTNITFLLTPLDNASNSALYVQGPVKASETGTAIPSGYVGNQITEVTDANGGTNSLPANSTRNLRVLTIPPGVWLVCGSAGINPTVSGAQRFILSLGKSSVTNGTSGRDRIDVAIPAAGEVSANAPCWYEQNSTNSTFYLVGYIGATSGTASVIGAIIRAIRLN